MLYGDVMKPRRIKSLVGIIVGAALTVVAPLVGLFGTVHGMNRSFASLPHSDIGNPNELSNGVGEVLHATTLSAIGGVCGLVLLAISVLCFVRAGRIPMPQSSPN
jgi:hypothetical protein